MRSAQEFLESRGIACARTTDRLYEGAPDSAVMSAASALGAAVLTHDRDFKTLWVKRHKFPNVAGLIWLSTNETQEARRRLEDAFSVIDSEFERARTVRLPPFIEIRSRSLIIHR